MSILWHWSFDEVSFKKKKQQNQSIIKIEMCNISSESIWKMKGLTTFVFGEILVVCGKICKTVSVFSSHRIGTWKDHTEVLLEFLPKRDRWLELPFFAVAGIFCSPENKKIILSQKLIFFLKKNTYHIAQNDFASRVLLSQTNENVFCLEN